MEVRLRQFQNHTIVIVIYPFYHFKTDRLALVTAGVKSTQHLERDTAAANDERTIRVSDRLIALKPVRPALSSSVRDEIKISDACRKAITDFSCDPQLTGLMRER